MIKAGNDKSTGGGAFQICIYIEEFLDRIIDAYIPTLSTCFSHLII